MRRLRYYRVVDYGGEATDAAVVDLILRVEITWKVLVKPVKTR